MSLRLRLLLAAVLWVAAALAGSGLALREVFGTYAEQGLGVELQTHLEELIAAAAVGPDGQLVLDRQPSDPRFRKPYSGLYWQIGAADAVVQRSRSLWDQTLAVEPDEPAQGELHTHRLGGPDGAPVFLVERMVTLPGLAAPVRFSVGIATTELDKATAAFGRTLAFGFVLLGAGLVVGASLQLAFALRPLGRMGAALAEVRAGRKARLDGRYPTELQPLVDELNALLDYERGLVERARRQAGDLAHGLKTPLAVIANAAEPGGTIAEQAERLQRQIERHLARARAAANVDVLGARAPVAETAERLARAFERLYAGRGLSIQVAVPADLAARGEAQDLEEMLGNLMDNACKWAASRVRVSAARSGDAVVVNVEDDGPGLAPEQREQVFAAGARLDETVPGSGLGLAIVRDLAELYRGTVRLEDSTLGGTRAVLTLPAAV